MPLYIRTCIYYYMVHKDSLNESLVLNSSYISEDLRFSTKGFIHTTCPWEMAEARVVVTPMGVAAWCTT